MCTSRCVLVDICFLFSKVYVEVDVGMYIVEFEGKNDKSSFFSG